MGMAYVREYYGVPAKRGRRVKAFYWCNGRWALAADGRITSASQRVHIGGVPFHPTDNLVYFADDGLTVLLDTREHGAEQEAE